MRAPYSLPLPFPPGQATHHDAVVGRDLPAGVSLAGARIIGLCRHSNPLALSLMQVRAARRGGTEEGWSRKFFLGTPRGFPGDRGVPLGFVDGDLVSTVEDPIHVLAIVRRECAGDEAIAFYLTLLCYTKETLS